ncbi:MAG: hypothetical protein DMG49_06520 [Acidobacteria bacterium]|nr:MAG: hypothetical protein DMG49_06520 [Acidobacteriota bacterium]
MNSGSKSIGALVLLVALILLIPVSPATAQTAATGQIVGTVTDPSKATIAQATITATNSATSLVRTTKTNSDGDYVVPLLPPGAYSISVAAPGFKTQTATNISVEVATTATVNIRLQLGEASQQVTVEATARFHSAAATTRKSWASLPVYPAPCRTPEIWVRTPSTCSSMAAALWITATKWMGRTPETWRHRARDTFCQSAAFRFRILMPSRNLRCKPACTTPLMAAAPAPM